MQMSTKQAIIDVAKVNATPIASIGASTGLQANDVLTYLNILLALIGISYAVWKFYTQWSDHKKGKKIDD